MFGSDGSLFIVNYADVESEVRLVEDPSVPLQLGGRVSDITFSF